ncbi:hypothetical protein [Bacillus sp. USDA818B3_A]|uniref:hypothetical protein n=1 Tax=Bacillus sp. USDA818B3_A TaxID=2698834 RepID=UPI0013708821|nr:hypothetical protein [Bacillus sp. USDA818B3_A]
MKYVVLEGKSHVGKYKYKMVGTIEASSLEIASGLVYKKFRREEKKRDGETYIIIPDSEDMNLISNNILPLDDVPYCMIKYWEPG